MELVTNVSCHKFKFIVHLSRTIADIWNYLNHMAIFDPILITYQILCLQCFFYLAMAVFLSLLYAIFDLKISLDHFFTPRFINFISMIGWIETGCFIASAVAGYSTVLLVHTYFIYFFPIPELICYRLSLKNQRNASISLSLCTSFTLLSALFTTRFALCSLLLLFSLYRTIFDFLNSNFLWTGNGGLSSSFLQLLWPQ